MNWFKRMIHNWLYDNQRVEAAGLSPQHPIFSVGMDGDTRHYLISPVENGFIIISRCIGDPYSPAGSSGPRATVTFCTTAEDLSKTIIAKMATEKLTAR